LVRRQIQSGIHVHRALKQTPREPFAGPVSRGFFLGWSSNEAAAINAARIAGKTDEEIRTLVLRLEAYRKDLK